MSISLYMKNKILGILGLVVTICSCFSSDAQIITTIAGNGSAGYSGDGGSAIAASFNMVSIAFDRTGNLYVADGSNNRVRIISTDGIVSTFAGNGIVGFMGDGGPATIAELNNPFTVFADSSGNIYFCDRSNYRVRQVNAMGVISTIAGTGVMGYSGDGGAATNAKLNPGLIDYTDAIGNKYMCDQSCVIRKIDITGTITTIAGNGTAGFSGDGGQATAAQLKTPGGIVVDGTGNLYIADMLNNRIRKVDASGVISTFAGTGTSGFMGDGGMATAARLSNPCDLAIDGSGNIYIADFNNKRIRKINTAGIITTIAGTGVMGFSGDGGPATAAQLNGAGNIALDCAGNLFIRDLGNNRIRMVELQHPPAFAAGHADSLTVCENVTTSINALLAITDSDAGQTETWSEARPPAHGTVTGAYSTTATGGTVIPAGLSYTPTTGYTGSDSFKIRISDCGFVSDSIVIYVTVVNCALGTTPRVSEGAEMLEVWPNPVNDELTIKASNCASFNISNTIGQVLLQQRLDNTDTKVNVKILPAGLYYLTLKGKSGNMVKKFVKL